MVVVSPDDPDDLASWGIVNSQDLVRDAATTQQQHPWQQQQSCRGGLPAIRSGSRCGSRPGSRANGGSRCSSRTLQRRRRHVADAALQQEEAPEPSLPPTALAEALAVVSATPTPRTSPEPVLQPPLQQHGSAPQQDDEFCSTAGGSLPGLTLGGAQQSSLVDSSGATKDCEGLSSSSTCQGTLANDASALVVKSLGPAQPEGRRLSVGLSLGTPVTGPVQALSHLRLDVSPVSRAVSAQADVEESRQGTHSSLGKSVRTTCSKALHAKRYPAPWCGQCTTRLKNPNLHCSVRIFPNRQLRDAEEESLNNLKVRMNQPVSQEHESETILSTGEPLLMTERQLSAFSRKPHRKFGLQRCDISKLELHLIQQKLKLPHMLKTLARAQEDWISECQSSDASLTSEDAGESKPSSKGRFETMADRLEVLKNLHLASLRTIVRMKVKDRSETDLKLMCKYFKSCKFFKDLPQAVVESVTEALELRRHEAGDVIYGECQPVHGIYLIIKGKVALVAGQYTVENHVALSEGTTVMNFRRHTLGGRELLDLGGLRDPRRWAEALYMWTAIAQVQSETLFVPILSLLKVVEDYNINQVIEACQHLPLVANNPREHFFRPSRVRREGRRATFHRLFRVDEFVRNTVLHEEHETGNPATAKIHVLVEGKVHFRRFGGVVSDLPIGTSFGEEALKNQRYSCTAMVASRVARLLSISVADYITQFCDGVAPVKTPPGSDGGNDSLSASESNSSEGVPASAPARVRIFASKKCYTKVRGQVQDLSGELKKRWRRRADMEALHREMWHDVQPRRAPRRVAPPTIVVAQPDSSALLRNEGGLKAPSRAGTRSSRKTSPMELPRCQTASTCAPPPSLAPTLVSVSPTRPSTSGTGMPSPKSFGVDMQIFSLPFMLTVCRPQTSDPDMALTTNASQRDQQLPSTEHGAAPPLP